MIIDVIFNILDKFEGGAKIEDDITSIVIKKETSGGSSSFRQLVEDV